MKVFNWHVPGTRDHGAGLSDSEARLADLRRAMAEAREGLRQETLRLMEQADDRRSDLSEAEGEQEPRAARNPLALPESVGHNPATLQREPVSTLHEPQQDPLQAWKTRWPNHCKACGGWGVFRRADHEPDASGEVTLRLCGALPPGTCHRCRAPDGIDVTNELSRGCRYCGWNYDDGVPEPSEPGKGQ